MAPTQTNKRIIVISETKHFIKSPKHEISCTKVNVIFVKFTLISKSLRSSQIKLYFSFSVCIQAQGFPSILLRDINVYSILWSQERRMKNETGSCLNIIHIGYFQQRWVCRVKEWSTINNHENKNYGIALFKTLPSKLTSKNNRHDMMYSVTYALVQ